MQTGEFTVSFLKRAAVDLADNEKVSVWETSRAGSVRFDQAAIHLGGKWRVSMIGNFLGGGLLGELLIKPFFLKARSESIPMQNLARAVVYRKKKTTTFHLFQARDQGMIEVHVFVAHKTVAPQIAESMKSVIPANLLREESPG